MRLPDPEQWFEAIARVVDRIDGSAVPSLLMDTLCLHVPFDAALLLELRPDRKPRDLFHTGHADAGLEVYIGEAYALDPFYEAFLERRSGVLTLRDVAPDDFRESEYYRRVYGRCGWQDGIVFMSWPSSDVSLALSVSRSDDHSRFSDDDIASCRQVSAAVDAALRHFWAHRRSGAALKSIDLRSAVERALDRFGTTLLTERESEVVRLLLRGHCATSIGEQLGISHETVRVHRRHAYAKLRVSSHAELFHLFISSLPPSHPAEDPMLYPEEREEERDGEVSG